MTLSSGQGTNHAMETSAPFANHLKRMADSCFEDLLTSIEVKKCLGHFQAHRQPRARETVELTNANVRVLILRTPLFYFIVNKVFPLLGDI